MILWLVGPSGSGKSTLGSILAERRNGQFVDTDRIVEEKAKESVDEIFRRQGEEGFRKLEAEAIEELVRKVKFREQLVVGTGGGSVIDPRNRDLMRSSGLRIYLDVDSARAIQRLVHSEERPLLSQSDPMEDWLRLRAERDEAYMDHDLLIDANGNPQEIVDAIVQKLHRFHTSSWKIDAKLDGVTSRIRAYRSPWSAIRAYRLATLLTRSFIITDSNLAHHYPELLKRLAGSKGVVRVVDPGEGGKSFSIVEQLVEEIASHGISREDCILGFGGGVITDLAGFVASIYMRGIRSFAMPTSLLAMVDASVGGKTAINASDVRNLVGTFSQPERVLICPAFLRTLPQRELRSGLVESMKMGIVRSKVLSDLVQDALPDVLEGKIPMMVDEVIRMSIATKLDVIGEDVYDKNHRALLNFGHTFAHALEAAAPGVWTHGEAVAFGMIAVTKLASSEDGGQSDKQRKEWGERTEEIVKRVLPLTNPDGERPEVEEIIKKMQRDKKTKWFLVRFVIPVGKVGTGWMVRGGFSEESIPKAIEEAWKLIDDYHGRTLS
ncbi:MAG: bifunctional shikimate kinase/3-dehydroquinate synthase [Candidatus Kapaibacterium sp.]